MSLSGNTPTDESRFTWQKAEPNSVDTDLPQFSEPHGPSPQAQQAKNPLDCFKLFFVPAIWSILVTQTNLYAQQKREAGIQSPSNRWHDVVVEKMMAYLAIYSHCHGNYKLTKHS